ncbi:MAG: hypothetical protein JO185_25315 [Acidobacteriaceae bacterium]|nr:hypothetical protein [Acidobacteriaceae bacterium]
MRNIKHNRRLALAASLWICSVWLPATQAQTATYPRDIVAKDGTITLYQPQVDTLEGNQLSGRAAFAFKVSGQTEPQFGALWFTAILDIDRSAGTRRGGPEGSLSGLDCGETAGMD